MLCRRLGQCIAQKTMSPPSGTATMATLHITFARIVSRGTRITPTRVKTTAARYRRLPRRTHRCGPLKAALMSYLPPNASCRVHVRVPLSIPVHDAAGRGLSESGDPGFIRGGRRRCERGYGQNRQRGDGHGSADAAKASGTGSGMRAGHGWTPQRFRCMAGTHGDRAGAHTDGPVGLATYQ